MASFLCGEVFGRMQNRQARMLKLFAACCVAITTALVASCGGSVGGDAATAAREMTGGEPSRGRAKMERYGCASCHTIPGVRGADSLVGPPLTRVASRTYVAGVLTNTPDNMIRWIKDPPGVDPLTAMPNLNVTDEDARDIAGYLYTLK